MYVDHIGQFLEEARKGECRIYTSGMTIAEMPKKRMLASPCGDFNEFLADYAGAITTISADPNVMSIAAEIKNLAYTKTDGSREVGTLDAVHLASALTLIDEYGVQITAFRTFDNGKGKGPDGKAVPLLSYHEWCEGIWSDPIVMKVTALARKRPDHPFPKLPMPLPIASKPGDLTRSPAALPTLTTGLPMLAAGAADVVDMSLLASIAAKRASVGSTDEPLAIAGPAPTEGGPKGLEAGNAEQASDGGEPPAVHTRAPDPRRHT